jgi:hypothetical protein
MKYMAESTAMSEENSVVVFIIELHTPSNFHTGITSQMLIDFCHSCASCCMLTALYQLCAIPVSSLCDSCQLIPASTSEKCNHKPRNDDCRYALH